MHTSRKSFKSHAPPVAVAVNSPTVRSTVSNTADTNVLFMISLNSVAHLPEGEWWNNKAWGQKPAPRSALDSSQISGSKNPTRTSSAEQLLGFGPGLSFGSLTRALALADSRQMLPLKPGGDWLNGPINQSGSLAWAGLKRPPPGPITSNLASHSHKGRGPPSLSLDRVRPFRWRELGD